MLGNSIINFSRAECSTGDRLKNMTGLSEPDAKRSLLGSLDRDAGLWQH